MNFKGWNWYMWISVWLGIMILSLVNIALIIAKHNQFLYNLYIFGISIIVLIVIIIMKSRSKK